MNDVPTNRYGFRWLAGQPAGVPAEFRLLAGCLTCGITSLDLSVDPGAESMSRSAWRG